MAVTRGLAPRHRARVTVLSVLVGVASVLLFAYSLRTVGLRDIADALGRLGPTGFLVVLALSGARFVVRSLAWMACVEGEGRLPLRDAFAATIMGEALGNLTPLATLISEPSKAVLVRGRVPLGAALPAIVIENVFYTATVGLMIGLGAAAFLLQFPLATPLRVASLSAIAGMLVIVGAAWLVLRAGVKPVSGTLAWLQDHGLRARWLGEQEGRVRGFEERVNTFTARNRRRLAALAAYEAAFHAAGVAEVYVTLALIAPDAVTLLTALVLEAVGRVINVLFKFVPMRFGVDEAGNLMFARPLALPQAALVALPLVRKARILVWTALGVGLLLMRGLSVRRAIDEAEVAGTTTED
jgi:hypothetical protein